MRRLADQILADAMRARNKISPPDIARPNRLGSGDHAPEKASRKLRPGYSGNRTGYNHQHSLPQYHAPEPDGGCAQGQPYSHFVCPLDNCIRNDAVATDQR
jgi:hypothetical protein